MASGSTTRLLSHEAGGRDCFETMGPWWSFSLEQWKTGWILAIGGKAN